MVYVNENLDKSSGQIIFQMVDRLAEENLDCLYLPRKHRLPAGLAAGFSTWFSRILFGTPYVPVSAQVVAYRPDVAMRIRRTMPDAEFLIKASSAGYRISRFDPEDPPSLKRETAGIGEFVRKSYELVRLKFKNAEVIPFTPEAVRIRGRGFYYKSNQYVHFDGPPHGENAFKSMSQKQLFGLILLAGALLAALLVSWRDTVVILIGALTIAYFADLLFNLFLIVKSFRSDPEIKFREEELTGLDDGKLPKYTVFCPLYKEWQVLPQFVSSMSRLDYPKDKLQVLLLLEENDRRTIEAARACRLPDYFQIVIVPDSKPKTKPKACNYGLLYASGEYSVIFDAEDVPDPRQLKKAVLAFRKSGGKVGCVQAKLNFYNPRQNILTRIFTAEYSLWFDLILSGLQAIGAPIPLGGTSNHFRTGDLRKFNGWDAFNVTEDCDLGMRLSKAGFKTAMMDSITLEEANSRTKNWLNQRSRWVKGYLQTYLVHMRKPRSLMKQWGRHILTFQLVVGGKIFSMFINPAMWTITFLYFFAHARFGAVVKSLFPNPVLLYMGVVSLIFGNFLYLYYYMIGSAKHGHYDIIKYVFLVPLYWIGMSIAAWLALIRLIYVPHEWSKTTHGFHLFDKKIMKQAENIIGNTLVDGNYVS